MHQALMCRVPENGQLDLIINCLEGEAKRQIFILDDGMERMDRME